MLKGLGDFKMQSEADAWKHVDSQKYNAPVGAFFMKHMAEQKYYWFTISFNKKPIVELQYIGIYLLCVNCGLEETPNLVEAFQSDFSPIKWFLRKYNENTCSPGVNNS